MEILNNNHYDSSISERKEEIKQLEKHKKTALLINKTLSSIYYEKGDYKKAARINMCGNYLVMRNYIDEKKKKLAKANFCKNSLCPLCQWRKTLKRGEILKATLEIMAKEDQNKKFYFITLTITNKEYLTRDFLLQFNKAGRNFIREYFLCNDFIETTEVTYSTKQAYHPHMHFILWTNNLGKKLSKRRLRFEWALYLKKRNLVSEEVYWQMADCKEAKNNIAYEISKYITKVMVLDQNMQELVDVIECLHNALKAVNMFVVSGQARKAKQEATKLIKDKLKEIDEYLEDKKYSEEFYDWVGKNYELKNETPIATERQRNLYKGISVETGAGGRIYFDNAFQYMDPEIYERITYLYSQLEPQEIYDAYVIEHKRKFNENWDIDDIEERRI